MAEREIPGTLDVHVAELPLDVTKEELKTLFSQVGTVMNVNINKKIEDKVSTYGFIRFSKLEHAREAAARFNYYPLRGGIHFIKVCLSNDTKDKLLLAGIKPDARSARAAPSLPVMPDLELLKCVEKCLAESDVPHLDLEYLIADALEIPLPDVSSLNTVFNEQVDEDELTLNGLEQLLKECESSFRHSRTTAQSDDTDEVSDVYFSCDSPSPEGKSSDQSGDQSRSCTPLSGRSGARTPPPAQNGANMPPTAQSGAHMSLTPQNRVHTSPITQERARTPPTAQNGVCATGFLSLFDRGPLASTLAQNGTRGPPSGQSHSPVSSPVQRSSATSLSTMMAAQTYTQSTGSSFASAQSGETPSVVEPLQDTNCPNGHLMQLQREFLK